MPRPSREPTPVWVHALTALFILLFLLFPGLALAYSRFKDATSIPLNSTTLTLLAIAIALGGSITAALLLPSLPPFFRARRAGVRIPLTELIGMRLRRSPVRTLIAAASRAKELNLDIALSSLESLSLAGGDPLACVEALAESRRRGFPVTWDHIVALDLAGRDVMAVARSGVDPARVIGRKEYADRWAKPNRA